MASKIKRTGSGSKKVRSDRLLSDQSVGKVAGKGTGDHMADVSNSAALKNMDVSWQDETPSDLSKRRKATYPWTFLIELSLTFVSVVAAVVSGFLASKAIQQSERALKLSEDANRIALDANNISVNANELMEQSIALARPNVQVEFIGYHHWIDIQIPCIEGSGDVSWYKELLAEFQVVNLGGQPIALVGLPEEVVVSTGSDEITAEITLSPFVSDSQFDEWWKKHLESSPLNTNVAAYKAWAILNVPVTLQPGEGRRIILMQQTTAKIDPELTPFEVSTHVGEHQWQARPKFTLADGSGAEVDMYVWGPYFDFRLYSDNALPFEACVSK